MPGADAPKAQGLPSRGRVRSGGVSVSYRRQGLCVARFSPGTGSGQDAAVTIILMIFWYVAIFVVVPFATSAIFALFYGLLVWRSTQSGIVSFSVLAPSLMIILCGAFLVFESARSNARLVFFSVMSLLPMGSGRLFRECSRGGWSRALCVMLCAPRNIRNKSPDVPRGAQAVLITEIRISYRVSTNRFSGG